MSVSKFTLNVNMLVVIILIMSWLFFALLSPVIYTAVNFIDKYLLNKVVRDYKALPIYTAIAGFFFGIIIWIFTGFPILPIKDTVIVLITGILTVMSLVLYSKALLEEETSKIIFLFQIIPLFSVVLSYIFLKEYLTINQMMGFCLVLISSILVVVDKVDKKVKVSKALFYLLIYDFIWALCGILMKYALNVNSFSKLLSYESIGVGIGGLILYLTVPSIRNAFNKNFPKTKNKALGIIFLNECVFIIAKSLSYFAFSLGPVALVSVLENTQVFYGVLIGSILTIFWPKIFNERMSKEALIKKIVLGIILVIGIILLT